MVAEDDDSLGAVLAQGLRSHGYVVDLVADGEAALSYARCYEYAVAVLDWLIPRVSGIDVVRQLRRTGARTPVLMISGKGAPEDRVAGLDAGDVARMVGKTPGAVRVAAHRGLRRLANVAERAGVTQ